MPEVPAPGADPGQPPPPRVSVVVPVYDVAEYLGGCLDSVLGQDMPDLEVIAVDDASPDGSGRILDIRADQDCRLRVVHISRNGGPGNARNVGLAHATGEYVWFIDADDLIADGALGAIAERLCQVRPEVLLIDYESRYPDGKTQPSPGRAEFRAAPAGTVTLAGRPRLINLTMTSWSKVIRRDYLTGLRVPFPAGIHEDVLISAMLLLRAQRIALLNRVCYLYSRARPGSFMLTPGTGHLDIFRSYARVFALVEERIAAADPVMTDRVRAAVFERAIWHYASVLEAGRDGRGLLPGGLVPAGERSRFFARMHADFVRYRPECYRLPGGARGAKLRLIERGAYRTYSLLEPLNQLRLGLRGGGRRG